MVSVFEQAAREAGAAWEKKQRDGYSLTPDDAHGSETFQCMLAQSYSDPKRKAEALKAADRKDLYSQPKLDGVRCIASAGGLLSRKNRPITAVPHIWNAVAPIFEKYPDLVLDGELYNHDLKDDFNEIVSMVRKSKPTSEELAQSEALRSTGSTTASPAHKDALLERVACCDVLTLARHPELHRCRPIGADEQKIDAWYAIT